jgi:hypothetical protein
VTTTAARAGATATTMMIADAVMVTIVVVPVRAATRFSALAATVDADVAATNL